MVQKIATQESEMLTRINADPVLRRRRERLQELIREHGGPKALATALGYENPSFLVQMAGPSPTRPVTEKTATAIEKSLALGDGWFDGSKGAQDVSPQQESLVIDVATCVHEVCSELHVALSAAKFRNIVTLAYSDAVAKGSPRADHIRQLIQLAT